MSDFITLMWKPLAACLILSGIHAYLGIHVVERKVIFVDLALAQIAALGATVALLFSHELHSPATYWFSLGATLIGAAIFAGTRMRHERIPHEAVIGVVYVVSAAMAILFLSRTAEGDEHIRHMLVGNILLVNTSEVVKMALLYAAVGGLHWALRKKFITISTDPDKAYAQGGGVRRWDFVFYLTFGIVVTSSVEIAGVLLVFTFLIVPAVAAMLFLDNFSSRLCFGWLMSALTSTAGIGLSYYFDMPTGPAIVCIFGAVLVMLAFFWRMRLRARLSV